MTFSPDLRHPLAGRLPLPTGQVPVPRLSQSALGSTGERVELSVGRVALADGRLGRLAHTTQARFPSELSFRGALAPTSTPSPGSTPSERMRRYERVCRQAAHPPGRPPARSERASHLERVVSQQCDPQPETTDDAPQSGHGADDHLTAIWDPTRSSGSSFEMTNLAKRGVGDGSLGLEGRWARPRARTSVVTHCDQVGCADPWFTGRLPGQRCPLGQWPTREHPTWAFGGGTMVERRGGHIGEHAQPL